MSSRLNVRGLAGAMVAVVAGGLSLFAVAGEQKVTRDALLSSADKRGASLVPSGLPMGIELGPLERGIVPNASVQRDAHKVVRYLTGSFATSGSTAEARAQNYLATNAKLFGLSAQLAELDHLVTQQSLTGTHVRYRQVFQGAPVVDGSLSVHMNRAGQVVVVNNDLVRIENASAKVVLENMGASAIDAAVKAVNPVAFSAEPPKTEVAVWAADGTAKGVTRVHFGTTVPAGDWDVMVENSTGEVLMARNRATFVDGSGLVFDPSPVVTSGIANLADNNDASSAQLDAQRFNVVLKDLDGTGFLEGPFVTTTPTTLQARANMPGLVFNFNRTDDRFEEVMCYFHLDRTQRYIQSLGFNNVNNRKQGVNVNGITDDNSFYSPSTKHVTFGTGGVDDGEDADVILHEYGHSIHDNQVPGWGSAFQARAMGEGFGDYWAGSQSAGVGPMAPGWDPFICEWDAVSYNPGNPGYLRVLNTTKVYPTNMTNSSVHADGEIWSAALWQIRALIGRTRADKIVLEHHFYLGTGASYPQAADAVLLANQNLYASADQSAIRQIFVNRGILDAIAAPSNLNLTVVNANRIDLAWTDNSSDELGFKVEMKIGTGAFSEIAVLGPNVTSYQATGLTGNTAYTFRLRSYNGEGNSRYSNEAGATTPFETHSIAGTLTQGGVGLKGMLVELFGTGNGLHSQSLSPGLSIPDNNTTGVTSTMNVAQTGTVQNLRVAVNITHTWIGDLEVALIHPDNTTVILHNRTGGSADNIVTSYPDLTAPAQSLAALNGKPLAGQWKLRVRDLAGADLGTLNTWSINVTYSGTLKRSLKTNSAGQFSFTNIPPGTYTVSPQRMGRSGGWTPKSRSVTVGPNATGVDFTLN